MTLTLSEILIITDLRDRVLARRQTKFLIY